MNIICLRVKEYIHNYLSDLMTINIVGKEQVGMLLHLSDHG